MTTYPPYTQLHGLVLQGVIPKDGVPTPSGGDRNIDSSSVPEMDYAIVSEQGRNMRKYSFPVFSDDLEDIDRICEEANNAPEGAKFYPFTSDRFCRIYRAQAAFDQPGRKLSGGQVVRKFEANVDVFCAEPFAYGADQGIAFQFDAALPQTASLTNGGSTKAGLDFLQASGDYTVERGYTCGLGFSLAGKTTRLSNRLMRNDRFRLDGYGHVLHSYETDFPMSYGNLQTDLHGPNYCDYDGGSMAYEAFTISGDGLIVFPFYGPLQIQKYPKLTAELTNVGAGCHVVAGFEYDLSDLANVDCDDLHIGTNEIYIPDTISEGFVAFGIRVETSTITIKNIKAEVWRSVAFSKMPTIEQNEAATLQVYDDSASNHGLKLLQAVFRNKYWS